MKRSHVSKNSKRLAVDIPIELHEELIKYAKLRHCTLKSFVVQALIKRLVQEEKYYADNEDK